MNPLCFPHSILSIAFGHYPPWRLFENTASPHPVPAYPTPSLLLWMPFHATGIIPLFLDMMFSTQRAN